MTRQLYIIVFFISLCGFFTPLKAQKKDFQNWISFLIKKGLTKQISIIGNQEIRFKNNASTLEDYISELGASFSINKHIKFSSFYRFKLNKNAKDGNSFAHRYCFDVTIKYAYSRFNFSFREKYQNQYSNQANDDFRYYPFQHLRHKVALTYDIPKSKLEPYSEVELYQALNNPIANGIEKTRYTFGVSSKISNYLTLQIYYRYQIKNNYINKFSKNYIVGTGIKINL